MDVESVPTTTGQQTEAGGEQQPGVEHRMQPKPQVIRDDYKGVCVGESNRALHKAGALRF
jgi:hypothetical protein